MSLSHLVKAALNRLGYDIRYHRPFYDTIVAPLKIRTILDIGANDGVYAEEMAKRFPEAKIYAFEPLAECFERLEAVSKRVPAITPIKCALGAETKMATIFKSRFNPSSSFLPMAALHKKLYPKSQAHTTEEVEVRRLDEVTFPRHEPMLVKIDVQGFENEVIEGGKETIAKASVVVVETSFVTLYEGQPLFAEVLKKLDALGFAYQGSVHTHHSKRTNRPLYEDSAFVRKDILERWVSEEAA